MQPNPKVPEGLQSALNEIKNTLVQNNVVYAQELPTILPETPISELTNVLFNNDDFLRNQFFPALVQRIIFSSVMRRRFNNPLRDLHGDQMPLGGVTQDIMVNRVHSAQFDVNDFAGLLAKYETDIKVIYNKLNWDHQYKATVTYDNLRNAFTSWETLYNFTDEISDAIYNEARIDDFKLTKYLIANAYRNNQVVMETVSAVTDQSSAKALVESLQNLYAQFQFPSVNYNAWALNGGYGLAARTWVDPENIVVFVKAKDNAKINVEVLAAAFNLDKADLMGRVYKVDNFDILDMKTDEVLFDGSNIVAAIADRRWFAINEQMVRFNQFFNANNETWQLYLHVRAAYNSRAFANMVLLVTETPTVKVTGLNYNNTAEVTIETGETEGLDINVTPVTATTPISYKLTKGGAASTDIAMVISENTRNVQLTPNAGVSGTYTLTASADDISTSINIVVPEAVQAQSLEDQVAEAVKAEVTTQLKAASTANTKASASDK